MKNSILIDTDSYLDKDQLCNQIEAGMNPKVTLRICLEKAGDKSKKLEAWIDDIRRIDELIRAENANFESIVRAPCETTRHVNTLAEPSCHINSNTSSASHINAPSSSSHPTLPKLTPSEHQLLFDNEGCLKCHRVFVPHRSAVCPNDFPDPSNYKPLTQSFVVLLQRCLEWNYDLN
jgi:hypothetical protein